MDFEYRQTDLHILAALAEYRILTVRHLLVLQPRNDRALRRRLDTLQHHGDIEDGLPCLSRGCGRPEELLSLTKAGVNRLKAEGTLAPEFPWEQATIQGLQCLEHHLLLNEVRLQLTQIPQVAPGITARFVTAGPTTAKPAPGAAPPGRERIPLKRDPIRSHIVFESDGVLALTDAKAGKSVLFFLEVDMGTESLRSPRGHSIHEKITNYQICFREGHYRRYEAIFGAKLQGFRLLFLADSAERMTRLAQLAQQTPPSDFIWLTHRDLLMDCGVGAPIWVRPDSPEGMSILGSRAPNPSPLPGDHPTPPHATTEDHRTLPTGAENGGTHGD